MTTTTGARVMPESLRKAVDAMAANLHLPKVEQVMAAVEARKPRPKPNLWLVNDR